MTFTKTFILCVTFYLAGLITAHMYLPNEKDREESSPYSQQLISEQKTNNYPIKEQPLIKNKHAQDLGTGTKNLDPSHESLVRKINILEAELVERSQSLERANIRISELKSSLDFETSEVSHMSMEKALEIIQEPFAGSISRMGGTMIDILNEHTAEGIDYNWSVLMEQQIKDFVYTHHLSAMIQLHKVACKTTTCQVSGFEKDKRAWSIVFDELREQEWYVFRSTSGTIGESEEYGTYFFEMLKR